MEELTGKQWFLGLLGEFLKFGVYAAVGFAAGMIYCNAVDMKKADIHSKNLLTARAKGNIVDISEVDRHVAELYKLLLIKKCNKVGIAFNLNNIEVWKPVGNVMKKNVYSPAENPTIGSISFKNGIYTVIGTDLWEGTVYKFKNGDLSHVECRG